MTERASRTSFNFRFNARQSFISNQNDKGFTIVELLIVIVVIAVLGAITFVSFNGVRKSAVEAGVKSELSSATKGFEVEQISAGSSYNPTNSGFLFKETSNTSIEYSYGSTQYFCMVARSLSDGTIIFHKLTSEGNTDIQSGACPDPHFRTQYRCIAGKVVSLYNLTNTTSQVISLSLSHSSNGDVEAYNTFDPGEKRTGSATLRVASVPRGLITFNIYDNATPRNLLETYYQASPALTCS